jgi:5-methyltetrahydrofolate--homocysteine methyltransferase
MKKCTYDPLFELINYFKETRTSQNQKIKDEELSIEEILKNKIIDGDKSGLESALNEALKKYPALEIVNNILLDGMKTVGELFGSGKMQLPFVLQSAEVMKYSVNYLERFMEKSDNQTSKGIMVIATVKGDVHDIGKNLVDIILTNNGYKVINLGIKCPVETMIEAAIKEKADAIGMSGLLVKSTLIMKENLEILNEQNISVPVILGGAALTKRFVENDLKPLYKGKTFYANDAFAGLKIMENLNSQDIENKSFPEIKRRESNTGAHSLRPDGEKSSSQILPAENIPSPPFYGTRIMDNIPVEDIFRYINEISLIRAQWGVRKKNLSDEEYNHLLEKDIYPVLKLWKAKIINEKLLEPKAVYGYFKCQSRGNDLIIYDESGKEELTRFIFPRQRNERKLCIADYFRSAESNELDTFCGFFVTVGKKASLYSKELYDLNKYSDYLYFHGLGVESAEALAEFIHKKIRTELGIDKNDSPDIKGLFHQGYQGSRYSFGYPACPNLEDQLKLQALLKPAEIGVDITEEYQLVPEQSVSAIIVHHPSAKYFNV